MSHYQNNKKFIKQEDKKGIFEAIVCRFAKINCQKQNPIKYQNFRRYPAQSLMVKKREVTFNFIDKVVFLTIIMICASIFANLFYLLFFVILYFIATTFISKDFIKDIHKINRGIDGELYVAQILNKVAINEAKYGTEIMIFHDIVNREKSYNIDHIIASNKGVFAIDTKAYSKRKKEDIKIKKDHIKKGEYKTRVEKESLIKSQAKWLEKELGVEVEPILAYIGWYVDNKENSKIDGVKIINISDTKFLSNILKNSPRKYDEKGFNTICKKLHKLSLQEDRSIHFCCS